MIVTSWRLTLVVFAVVPTIIVAIALYGRIVSCLLVGPGPPCRHAITRQIAVCSSVCLQVRRLATKYSDALGYATDTAQESISNIRTMRSFAGEFVEVPAPGVKYTRSITCPNPNLQPNPQSGGQVHVLHR